MYAPSEAVKPAPGLFVVSTEAAGAVNRFARVDDQSTRPLPTSLPRQDTPARNCPEQINVVVKPCVSILLATRFHAPCSVRRAPARVCDNPSLESLPV